MDDNVMKKYTTPPTEARHYVQYDQGRIQQQETPSVFAYLSKC